MQTSSKSIIETIEGKTKILVPIESLTEKVPPREPAFFNPKAKLNRDFSILVYSTFWKSFEGPKIFVFPSIVSIMDFEEVCIKYLFLKRYNGISLILSYLLVFATLSSLMRI